MKPAFRACRITDKTRRASNYTTRRAHAQLSTSASLWGHYPTNLYTDHHGLSRTNQNHSLAYGISIALDNVANLYKDSNGDSTCF